MLDITLGLSGRYKLERITPKGDVELAADWFDNLITNQGLDMYSGDITNFDQLARYCFVGTDSTPPNALDTDLLGFVAQEDGGLVIVQSYSLSPRYYSAVFTYTFDVGAVVGNISELGVGDEYFGTRKVFSRALIKDGVGSPTTISVAADEALRVTYEIRFNLPTSDFLFTVDGYDFVVKLANANTAGAVIGNDWSNAVFRYPRTYPGAVGATIDGIPAGNPIDIGTSLDTYVLGSYTRTGKLVATVDQANFSILAFSWGLGVCTWQCSVSPAVVKDNTKQLELGVQLTWAREGELP